MVSLAAALATAACTDTGRTPEPATLVVTGARVFTGDDTRPWAEAVAARGERIVAVGSAAEVAPWIGDDTEVIAAEGAFVVPGFIDSHVHFLDGGVALASVQLRDAASPEDFTARVAAYAASVPAGEWILGGTWDHENWGGVLPHRDWIDAVTPDHPLWIQRLDGHMALANTRVLALAGIDETTPDVAGGEIVRDADGRPTGILKDNAMGLVEAIRPPLTEAQLDRALDAAMAYVASNGVTSVHHMGTFADLEVFRRAHARGALRTRIDAFTPLAEWEALAAEVAASGRGDAWLKIGGLKGFMDGSLGSHTAAFLEPFTDTPDDRGFLINDLADMRRWIEGADAAGLHVAVHAIGDRANRELLDIFAAAVEKNGARDRRFRVEHAQHLHPDDLGRFAAQGVIASMQPYHAIDDGRWAEKVIGPERAKGTYAFASLLATGARLAFGSDWFVAPASPIQGIDAAVTRRTLDGAHPGGWVPDEKITVEQALRAYTADAAFAAYEEGEKGKLAPGFLADLVVLDRDITAVAPEAIREARVLTTVAGGRVVYRGSS